MNQVFPIDYLDKLFFILPIQTINQILYHMSKFPKFFTFILLGLISVSLSAQELNPKVNRLANRINTVGAVMIGVEASYLDKRYDNAKNNSIDDFFQLDTEQRRYSVTGRNPQSARQYNISYNKFQFLARQRESQIRNFRDLTDKATVNELLKLTDHESPTVRCYAFWGLLEQHYAKSFDLLMTKLEDDQNVGVLNDDDLVEYKVGDFYILLMSEGQISSYLKKMTKEEESKLNAFLLNAENNNLETRRKLILELEPNQTNYSKIRTLAKNTKDPNTLALLAQYQKEEDLPLINGLFFKTNKYAALKAARAWPHEEFLPKIKKIYKEMLEQKKGLYESNVMMVYQALAQYPSDETATLMEKAFKVKKNIIRNKHLQFLWLALHKYPNEAFTNLFNSIRIDSYQKREALERVKY